MIIQKKIEVGVLRKQPPQVVDLVQYDTGIQLVFIVADFEIPAGTTAMLYIQKPSGKFVYQESGITISGNAVTVDLENQALTEYGVAGYQLQLTNGENRISTFAGILRVEKSLAEANAEESKSVITGFDKAITKRVTEFVGAYLKENPVSDGEDGATFTPAMDVDGNLSWSNDKGLKNPETVNIKGPRGEKGEAFTYDDFTEDQLESLRGPQGESGGIRKSIDFSIPVDAWMEDRAGGAYPFYYDLVDADITESMIPYITLDEQSLEVARNCGLCATASSYSGYVRMTSELRPSTDIGATCYVFVIGPVSENNNSINGEAIATDEEVEDMLADVFDAGNSGTTSDEEIATDEEVEAMLGTVFDSESSDSSTDGEESSSGETNTGNGADSEIATDEEVQDTVDDIFGL